MNAFHVLLSYRNTQNSPSISKVERISSRNLAWNHIQIQPPGLIWKQSLHFNTWYSPKVRVISTQYLGCWKSFCHHVYSWKEKTFLNNCYIHWYLIQIMVARQRRGQREERQKWCTTNLSCIFPHIIIFSERTKKNFWTAFYIQYISVW